MPELITLSFPTLKGAEQCLRALSPLEHEHLIRLTDFAWGVKRENGKTESFLLHPTAVQALLRGSFWGTLAGALFLEPFFGMLLGGSTALFTASLRSTGATISPKHVDRVLKRALEPGQSALFLMVAKATPDKVLAKLHKHQATIVSTSLSVGAEAKLREMWQKIREEGPLTLHNPSESEGRTTSRSIPS